MEADVGGEIPEANTVVAGVISEDEARTVLLEVVIELLTLLDPVSTDWMTFFMADVKAESGTEVLTLDPDINGVITLGITDVAALTEFDKMKLGGVIDVGATTIVGVADVVAEVELDAALLVEGVIHKAGALGLELVAMIDAIEIDGVLLVLEAIDAVGILRGEVAA